MDIAYRSWLGSALLFIPLTAAAIDFNITNDADFDTGVLNGVNHDAPNNNQLQLNATGSTFPVMWIANAGEDTLSRINTDTNCEEARYGTWLNHGGSHSAFAGPAPSRSAVDGDGNVFIANRHFDGRPASVLKILSEGGIDRNNNGVIDTSSDTNGDCIITPDEMIPLVDTNGNNVLDDNELADERVAWVEQIGPAGGLGRSLCIAGDGNVWLGLFSARSYYKVSAVDGSVMAGPIATSNNHSPYGCVVDAEGTLFSASLGSSLGVLDTNTQTWLATLSHSAQGNDYGITAGNGKVYQGSSTGRSYIQYDPNSGAGEPDGNPATGTFSTPAQQFVTTLGISVEGDGNIVLGTTTTYKFDKDTGAVIWSTPNPANDFGTRGVLPDANNDIWTVNLSRNTVSKFRGSDGAFLGQFPVGRSPYTYSDATGFSFRNTTNPSGLFTVILDGNDPGTEWALVSWNNEPEGTVPTGASIEVAARTADVQGNLPFQAFEALSNGGAVTSMGRFIELRATLKPNSADESPVLSDLFVQTASVGSLACDVDADGDVDMSDIQAISAARNTPSSGPDDVRDNDGNGVIDVNDARQCTLQCTKPRCAS